MADRNKNRLPALGDDPRIVHYPGGQDLQAMAYADEDGRDGDDRAHLLSLVAALWRQKWLILGVWILVFTAVVAFTLTRTPIFEATAMMEVQAREVEIMQGAEVEPLANADAQHMATQLALLRSRSLAERVAETLNLAADPRYADQELPPDARLAQAVSEIEEGLEVREQGRSRVLVATFSSPSPADAARIINSLADEFIASNLERRFNTTAFARTFLEERLQATRLSLEDAERRLVSYAREQRVLDLSSEGVAAGGSLDGAALMALNASLSEAENERITAEQRWKAASDGDLPDDLRSNGVILELRQARAQVVAQRAELTTRFREDYPQVRELTSRIDGLDAEITAEEERAVGGLQSTYLAAAAREEALRQRVAELSGEVQDLRTRSIDYNILAREVDTLRSQYDALLQRYREVSISSGIGSSQVSIVDRALVPELPAEPSIPRWLLLGAILGLAVAIGLALFRNFVDDTIKTPDDVKEKLGLPVIGVVPRVKGQEEILSLLADPRSPVTEAFNSARVALRFSTSAGAPRSLLITGVRPSEGKTSCAAAFAMVFAGEGKRVLIIDGDMRQPSFSFEKGASVGLSGLLTGEGRLLDNVIASPTPNLFLLPVGVLPPNPAELLTVGPIGELISEAAQAFDFVIVDSPPVLDFADSPVIASHCEATMLVLAAGSVRRPLALRVIERLRAVNGNLIGVMLTKFDAERAGYGYGYGAYGKGYGYSSDGDRRSVEDEVQDRRKVDLFLDHREDLPSGRSSHRSS